MQYRRNSGSPQSNCKSTRSLTKVDSPESKSCNNISPNTRDYNQTHDAALLKRSEEVFNA